MPLETATYIADLNSSNPAATDSPAQADDHLRLIKAALKAQFPNFTAAAVAATNAAIDAAVTATANGASVLADAGAFFKTNTTDGFTNPSAGEVDVKAAGSIVAKFKSDLTTTFVGAVAAPVGLTGPGATPVGASVIWWSDTLPSGNGTWAFCNGGTFPRSNTALYGILGTTFGAGDGSTTANLPDLRQRVPFGKGTMGGASDPGLCTKLPSGSPITLGSLIGEGQHTLIQSESANWVVTGVGTSLVGAPRYTRTDSAGSANCLTGSGATVNAISQALADADITNFRVDVAPFNIGGGNGSHNNVQPSLVCNWIIRTA